LKQHGRETRESSAQFVSTQVSIAADMAVGARQAADVDGTSKNSTAVSSRSTKSGPSSVPSAANLYV